MTFSLNDHRRAKAKFAWLILLSLNAFACGKPSKSESQNSQDSAPNANLVFEQSISKSLTADVGKDLQRLRGWNNYKNVEAVNNLKKILNLKEISGPILESWFYDRIQYVVPYTKAIKFSFAFKNEKELVDFDISIPNDSAILAANVSSGLIQGVKDKTLEDRDGVFLHINGQKKQLLSAHKGIMVIGAGYEVKGELAAQIPTVNSIRHISTLLHEARHSDGNIQSKTLGMSHEKCPASVGPEYEGQYACDNSWNGPYNVGAFTSEALAAQCATGCTKDEQLFLLLLITDAKSRILVENKPANYWDATPESSLSPLEIVGFTTFGN